MVVHEEEPFNAETGLAALGEGPLTATDAFYVRGHAAVPVQLHILIASEFVEPRDDEIGFPGTNCRSAPLRACRWSGFRTAD